MRRSTLHLAVATAALGLAAFGGPDRATAQTSDFYVGQLQQFGMNWCPRGWASANGALLPIASNTTLFSVIGTTYGGDGRTTFALPDLRDRAPVGMSGTLPIGAAAGQSSVTLTVAELPAHTHDFNGDPTPGVSNDPTNSMMGEFPAGASIYAPPSGTPNEPMNTAMAVPAGGSQPVSVQMPVLATSWCIALSGIYPQRP